MSRLYLFLIVDLLAPRLWRVMVVVYWRYVSASGIKINIVGAVGGQRSSFIYKHFSESLRAILLFRCVFTVFDVYGLCLIIDGNHSIPHNNGPKTFHTGVNLSIQSLTAIPIGSQLSWVYFVVWIDFGCHMGVNWFGVRNLCCLPSLLYSNWLYTS